MNTHYKSKVIAPVLFSALVLGGSCKKEELPEVSPPQIWHQDDQFPPLYPWLRACSDERLPLNEPIEINGELIGHCLCYTPDDETYYELCRGRSRISYLNESGRRVILNSSPLDYTGASYESSIFYVSSICLDTFDDCTFIPTGGYLYPEEQAFLDRAQQKWDALYNRIQEVLESRSAREAQERAEREERRRAEQRARYHEFEQQLE
ncbi:hypothetical protein HYS49_02575 [Candidatus Woesearchaeota archaeon]|nr:hypothetical protein [Candidatus Woesearchaeota archaeon]